MDITKIYQNTIKFTKSIVSQGVKISAGTPKTAECPEKLLGTLDCIANNSKISIAMQTDTSQVLPEFLYHLTGNDNAKSIIKDGKIKYSTIETGKNRCSGIYLIDKVNYLKNWCGTTIEFFDDSDIGRELLFHTGQTNGKIVALKIPTSTLDLSKLRFRPYFDLAKEYIETQKTGKTSSLLEDGFSIDKLPKYSNQPIEFIYKDEIPTKIIQLDSTGYLDYHDAVYGTFSKNTVEKLFS